MDSGLAPEEGAPRNDIRFPDAMQHEVLLRRAGIVPNAALVTAPALQRTTP
jgi:hypothetical protein